MPIYYGNTKLDITSKGIVKKATSQPAYNEKFYIRCFYNNTTTYFKCVIPDSIPLLRATTDISEASTCYLVQDARGDALMIDGPDGNSYNITVYSQSDGNYHIISVGFVGGAGDKYALYLEDFDNMYIKRWNSSAEHQWYGMEGLIVRTASGYDRYYTHYGEYDEYVSWPVEFCKVTDIIQTPAGIGKVYYGNTLVYDKDNN